MQKGCAGRERHQIQSDAELVGKNNRTTVHRDKSAKQDTHQKDETRERQANLRAAKTLLKHHYNCKTNAVCRGHHIEQK